MYQNMQWNPPSQERLKISQKNEPIQPFFFLELERRLRPSTILDIGANIGLYSIFAAAHSSNPEIHAFEPAPHAFTNLKQNLILNDMQERITAHQIAASDRHALLDFGIVNSLSGKNSVLNTTIHDHNNFRYQTSVTCAPIDSLLTKKNQTLLIKIDVEGHENNVLSGMLQLLSQNSVVLQIEDYGILDHEKLNQLNLQYLLKIGADVYFTNSPNITRELALNQLEAAIGQFIAERRQSTLPTTRTTKPLRLKLGKNISLQITGHLARDIRRLSKKLCGVDT